MTFSLSTFIQTNKVFLIWAAFGTLLYLFRDMFGLVFITFIMCFIAYSLTHKIHRHVRLPRRLIVAAIYLLFLVAIVGFLFFLIPRVIAEARSFTDQLPLTLSTIEARVDSNLAGNEYLYPISQRFKTMLTPEQVIMQAWGIGRTFLEKSVHYVSWFFLGLLFSFLIMMDLPRLTRGVRSLRHTRLASIYEETADSVVLFAEVVGESFRAQIMISTCNTILTAIGLQILGIDGAVLLCTLVFFCGLVPVLGVFISSVPIVLMAVNSGGVILGLWAVVMIVLIHFAEAYFLNPRIMSAVMRINPVITLIILYIAHSLIGLWGMVLGVPIAVYIYRQMIIGLKPRLRAISPPVTSAPADPAP